MRRRFLQVTIVVFIGVLVASACTLPFLYPTQTLWYKTGWDKVFLLAGHLFGVLAFLSLLLQLLLGSRGKLLEDSFGVAGVMRWHRGNGLVLPLLALCHVGLVLLPEGLANLPLGAEFWPEMVGGLLFFAIVVQAGSSFLRQRLGLDYRRWRSTHRLIGYLALLVAVIHVLFVADSFTQGVPRMALLTVVALLAVRLVLVKRATGRGK